MNGVLGMAQLLLGTDLSPEQRHYTETVLHSAGSLLDIINGILDFSKIEAGRMDLEIADFDLRAAVEEVTELMAVRAAEKDLELVVVIDPRLPAGVRGDVGRVRQILLNLIGNAVKFTEQGQVVARVEVLSASNLAVQVRVEIIDTGIGIAPEAQANVFTSFSQGDLSTTRTYGGTGLGLSISKQLVELMGGEIGVDSTVGQGSTFWFTLGFEPAPGAGRPPPMRADLVGLSVLIVDANTTTRGNLECTLRDWGVDTSPAADGTEALALLRSRSDQNQPVALAIIDHRLPQVDGVGLARAIAGDPRIADVRLVLLRSSGRNEDHALASSVGIEAVLTKPVRQSALHDCLATVAGSEQAPSDDDSTTRATPAEPRLGSGVHLLVVDDDAVNQKVAVHMLEGQGHRVDVAADGAEAVEAVGRVRYAAVLMDCQMPDMDGYEAAQAIRALEGADRHTPIIAMTAGAMVGDRERCVAAGMDDYVTKPVWRDELLAAVGRWTKAGDTPGADTRSSRAGDPAQPDGSEVLDPATIAGLRELDGEEMANLVETFSGRTVGLVEKLRGSIEGGDSVAVARTCHTLKGASATLGASTLAELFGELEEAALTQGLAGGANILQRLEAEVRRVRPALRAAFPGSTDPTVGR
ncbi:MAG: response regulator [Actinomycetota bacterium]|nr:response regulator [Actinomycetota bacterium]